MDESKDDLERRLKELGIVPGRRDDVDAPLDILKRLEREESKSDTVYVPRLSNNSKED